jgi:type III secretion protein J
MKSLPVFFCIFLLMFLSACTDKVAIINGVDEREANEIVVFLASKGIDADKTAAVSTSVGGAGGPQMWNIFVDPSHITDALAILNRNGLPRKQGQNLLEIFSDSGLVPTEMQQKIRYQAGLAQQIANTIRQIDGVIDATVQISIPQDTDQSITAAVYVKHQGVLDNPNSQLVTKIKQLVAGSVPGLKLENVTVISDRSRFTDVTLAGQEQTIEEEKDYAVIWGVTVAKASIGLFRFYFIFFCLIILLLGLAIFYLYWKCRSYIEEKGGFKFLLDTGLIGKKEHKEKPAEQEISSESSERKSDEDNIGRDNNG